MKFLLLAAFAITAFAQDKITLSVTVGTQTRTAVIDGAVVADAFKALDADVAAGSGTERADALREAVINHLLAVLENVPGTAISQATTALSTAAAAQKAAVKAFSDAAKAKPIQ